MTDKDVDAARAAREAEVQALMDRAMDPDDDYDGSHAADAAEGRGA
jgi:hypothetical protein